MKIFNIGKRLLEVRIDKGLNQKKFSEISSVSQSFVCDVEQNKSIPSSNFLLSIYECFDVDINWLLTGDGQKYLEKKHKESKALLTPGQMLKKCRKALNYTQNELSLKLNVTQGFLSSIESNRFSMGAEFLYELNRQLNVNINWLLAGDGPMFLNAERPATVAGAPPDQREAVPPTDENLELTPDEIRALKAILTKPYLKSIVIMADNMSDEERNKLYAYTTEQKRISDLKRGSTPDDNDMPNKKRA